MRKYIHRRLIALLPFLLAGAFGLIVSYANAQDFRTEFKSNKLALSAGEISIKNGQFSVHLLVKEQLVLLKPFGDPLVKVSEVPTPAGLEKLTTYTWIDHSGYKYSWLIGKIGQDITSIRVRFTNGSLQPVLLQKFTLLSTPGGDFSVQGNAADWMLASTDVECRRWGTLDKIIPTSKALRSEGAYSRSYFLRRSGEGMKANDPAWRCYFGDATLYRRPGITGVSMAAVDTVADVYFDIRVEQTRMKLEITSNMSEIRVDPGEMRSSDEVLFIRKPWASAQKIKNNWIAEVSGATVTKKPVFGWCSWYRSATDITQQKMYDMTAYVKSHFNKVPFDVIQLDDGWEVSKSSWNEDTDKFKGGLSALADSIHQAGMMAGIWLSPLRADLVKSETGKTMRPHPAAWYVRDSSGNRSTFQLDPTNPAARKFIYTTLKHYYEQGFRYFKLDFSSIAFDAKRFYNPKVTRFQAQRELFRLFREAIGPESYLLACGINDERSLVPFVDADRIGTDTNGYNAFSKSSASDGQPADIQGFWYPVISMVNKSYENGVLFNADPDVTYTGHMGKCTLAQLQTFHSFVGLLGGTAMISDHLYDKKFDNADNLRMMEILSPIGKEKGHPFAGGWDIYGREYGYEVHRSYGNAVNMIIWNPEHNKNANLSIQHVPAGSIGNKFHVWSFWDEKYLGIIDRDYMAKDIPEYESELLRLTPVSSNPVFIGSNLHISMGAVEVKSMVIDNKQVKIELDPNAGARNGRLYFYSRKPLGNALSTNSETLLVKKQDNIYVLVLKDRSRDKREVITMDIAIGKSFTLSQVANDPSLRKEYGQSSFSSTSAD